MWRTANFEPERYEILKNYSILEYYNYIEALQLANAPDGYEIR